MSQAKGILVLCFNFFVFYQLHSLGVFTRSLIVFVLTEKGVTQIIVCFKRVFILIDAASVIHFRIGVTLAFVVAVAATDITCLLLSGQHQGCAQQHKGYIDCFHSHFVLRSLKISILCSVLF